MKGTHDYRDDPHNRDILIDINGHHFHRDKAMVSVFDSGFVLGDGVWEGSSGTSRKNRLSRPTP